MKTVQSKDRTSIAYDIHGKGPTLIFITGAICFRKFGPVEKDAKTFSKEFSVINYDRRGRGDSGDLKPYALEKEIDDIEALIDATGGSAVVYGHSSGAVLALEAALKFPNKISKVAIYDAPYVHDENEKSKYALLKQEVMLLIRTNKNAKALRKFLVGIGMPKFFVYLMPLMPGWSSMKNLAPTLEYDMLLTKDLPPVERFEKIKIPVQVMYGEKNPVGISQVAEQLAQGIPGAQLIKVPGQDHMVSPKVLLPYFVNFLKS